MGGRGAFINVNEDDFRFVENGQTFFTIGEIDGVQIIVRKGNNSLKAPEYSHTGKRTYAIVGKNGKVKCIAYYDENHDQRLLIDFDHKHGINKVKPHIHIDRQHIKNEPGTPARKEDIEIYNKVNNWLDRR